MIMPKKIKYKAPCKAPYIVYTREDVDEMINDGFFEFTGSHGYVGASVINYLVNMKIIEADRVRSGSCSKYVLPKLKEKLSWKKNY